MSERVRWAGIDEAGLGPLLGPMTFGWSVLELPSADTDPWKALRTVVARKPGKDKRRIAVADSKVVFSRNAPGRRRLTLAALAFDALTRDGDKPPANAFEYLFGPVAPKPAVVKAHPWYAQLQKAPFPPEMESGAIELWAAKLRRAFTREDIALLDTGVRVVPAGELNRSFDRTESKSQTHWNMCAEVLRHLWQDHAAAPNFHVAVDKHGARDHYAAVLGSAFPEAIVEETAAQDGRSSYQVIERVVPGSEGGAARREMSITFSERAEESWFSVALASCLAKYARELIMGAFNEYFEALQPGLEPTAGYTQDGRRWLADARGAVNGAQLPKRVLVRER